MCDPGMCLRRGSNGLRLGSGAALNTQWRGRSGSCRIQKNNSCYANECSMEKSKRHPLSVYCAMCWKVTEVKTNSRWSPLSLPLAQPDQQNPQSGSITQMHTMAGYQRIHADVHRQEQHTIMLHRQECAQHTSSLTAIEYNAVPKGPQCCGQKAVLKLAATSPTPSTIASSASRCL